MKLDDINGVGPTTKESLKDVGINTIDDLASSSIEDITEAGISENRANDFKYKAKQNTIEIQTGKPSILIETERDRFRPKRAESIASDEETVNNIHRVKAYTLDKQYSSYDKVMETFNEASVVVVDSLTARIRLSSTFDGRGTLSERSAELGKHLIKLEEMAERLSCPVLFTNQIYKNPDSYGKNVIEYGGSKIQHTSSFRLRMSKAKGDMFEAEVQKHPSTGDTSVIIDIGDDDITGVN